MVGFAFDQLLVYEHTKEILVQNALNKRYKGRTPKKINLKNKNKNKIWFVVFFLSIGAERKARLDALEWWVWSERTEWRTRFDELVAFHAKHGTLPSYSTGGLGNWASTQRQTRATMDADRRSKLDALPFWAWNVIEEEWNERLAELVLYFTEHGALPHASTPGIGSWMKHQHKRRSTMDVTHKERLESLQWWA